VDSVAYGWESGLQIWLGRLTPLAADSQLSPKSAILCAWRAGQPPQQAAKRVCLARML
jgi:hypothetical protein